MLPGGFPGAASRAASRDCFSGLRLGRIQIGVYLLSGLTAGLAAASGQDPTGGATYYYNPYLVSPYWAKGMKVLIQIGTDRTNTHVFLTPG